MTLDNEDEIEREADSFLAGRVEQAKADREAAAISCSAPWSDDLALRWFNDLQPNLETPDFIEGVMTAGAMSVVYGDSNCGKTFFMTNLAFHVAWGRAWCGREVDQGGVIYCALEGSHGVGNRIAALREYYQQEIADKRIPFAVVQTSINMLDPAADTQRLIDAIRAAEKTIDMKISLVVIDTLSRALSGGNENGPEDMGRLVINTDRIRQETGVHICYVHHTGKDAAKGSRGHSSLRAATDTEIEVSRPNKIGPSIVTVVKQRDLPLEGSWTFTLETIELGLNRRKKPVTSCVVIDGADRPDNLTRTARRSPAAQLAFSILRRALSKHGKPGPATADYPPAVLCVTVDEWRQEFYQGCVDAKADTKSKKFRRGMDMLLADGTVQSFQEIVWFKNQSYEPGA